MKIFILYDEHHKSLELVEGEDLIRLKDVCVASAETEIAAKRLAKGLQGLSKYEIKQFVSVDNIETLIRLSQETIEECGKYPDAFIGELRDKLEAFKIELEKL